MSGKDLAFIFIWSDGCIVLIAIDLFISIQIAISVRTTATENTYRVTANKAKPKYSQRTKDNTLLKINCWKQIHSNVCMYLVCDVLLLLLLCLCSVLWAIWCV